MLEKREDQITIRFSQDPESEMWQYHITTPTWTHTGGPYISRAMAVISAGNSIARDFKFH